jgi:hypothetical protein
VDANFTHAPTMLATAARNTDDDKPLTRALDAPVPGEDP